jgi:hypothetical protein
MPVDIDFYEFLVEHSNVPPGAEHQPSKIAWVIFQGKRNAMLLLTKEV